LEALLRWNHPVRGEVGPGHFIPIAEQSGLITDLGHFALRQAFVDSRRWPQLTVAINISASQIRDRAFISELAKLVDEHQVDPARFDLEITEGILLGDEPEIQERLGELRQMGFGLALDDFGTGYSSLSYLHRYPISKIKIDRSFVANLGVEPQAGAVIDAIVKLARALHLQVVAEGVETAPQFRQLARSGCHAMQGFLLSRPVIADEVADLLTRVRGIPADKARAA
jgi:EAL domain-containing protein (putative c-di-GMP-specific phosphodiesterase class I)